MTDAMAGIQALAAGAPTIDIDATLAIQFVLFVFTWFFLSRVVFKPYLTAHRERVRLTEGEREKATSAATRADTLLAEYETKLSTARAEAATIRTELAEQGKTEAGRLVDSARADSQRTVESARTQLETDLAAAREEVEPRATVLADAIAAKVLA